MFLMIMYLYYIYFENNCTLIYIVKKIDSSCIYFEKLIIMQYKSEKNLDYS